MAPEVMNEERFNSKIDMWGVGIMLLEWVTLYRGFTHLSCLVSNRMNVNTGERKAETLSNIFTGKHC